MQQRLAKYNNEESTVTIKFSDLCKSVFPPNESAIDTFYRVRDVVIVNAYKDPFASDPSLRSNLLLLLFSGAESYFRRIISEVLSFCPIAAEAAAQQQVAFGAISTFGISNLGFAFSDTKGLTSSGEIINRTKNMLGISISKTSSIGVSIEEFERICNFRHSIAHSSGELLYTNRRDLKIATSGRLQVEIDNKGIQDIAQIVVNCVRAYNNFVANELIQRWFSEGCLRGRWQSDRRIFNSHYSTFSSRRDGMPSDSAHEIYKTAKSKIKMREKNL
ncbi:hypothetical protein HI802_13550 [Ralstonia solanacearum]|nr:hypothetical protein HI802_13550 [Ralstonia solanacearum]QKL98121.1 hypothetical protein HI801_13555 [Ralstonia solanacearum]QLR08012.1 hypothetical protein H1A20_13460 [Ralstonia solanacearum]